MVFVVIVVIAIAILTFFAFSGGSSGSTPAIREDVIEDSAVNAAVKEKDIRENRIKRNHSLTYFVMFDCEDGVSREFEVPSALYNAIETGEQGELVYMGERFLGFGDYGAVETDSEPVLEDGFTYDDYDESIDFELDPAAQDELSGLDPETQESFALFRDRKILPAKTETVADEAVALGEYPPLSLLEKTTVYPFLKREDAVRRMFLRTYGEALSDLLGFDGDSRKGSAADSEFINKNEIRVLITLQETTPPLLNRITAEFGVNE